MPTACACARAPRRTTGIARGFRPPSRAGSLGGTARPLDVASYFRLIELRSQAAFAWLRTGLTFAARTRYGLSHIHGIAEAVPMTSFSIAGHALARAASPATVSPLSIFAFGALSFN